MSEEKTPKTLEYYMKNCPEELVGKIFQSGTSELTIQNVYSSIETRHLNIGFGVCDWGDEGHSYNDTIDLHLTKGLHDKEELIEGVNAERINPLCYRTSI